MNTPPDSATGDAPAVPGAASKSSTGAAPASAAPDPICDNCQRGMHSHCRNGYAGFPRCVCGCDSIVDASAASDPLNAAPDPLNPTPTQLFDALKQTGVEYIVVHCWCRQFELRFMAGGSYVTDQWSEVLRFIGLYQPVEEESEET